MREESEVKILFKILMMLELMCQSICINYSYESQSSVLDFLICQGCTNKKKRCSFSYQNVDKCYNYQEIKKKIPFCTFCKLIGIMVRPSPLISGKKCERSRAI